MARTRAFDKEAVLEKAMRLFQCRSYEAASVQEITEAIGLSRSSLYDTFGDKNGLYRAALDHYITDREKWVWERLRQPSSAKQAIREVFDRVIREIIAAPEFGCFAVNAATELAVQDSEVREVVARNVTHTVAAFVGAIRIGQQQGEVSPGKDPQALAEFLVNAIQGLRITGKTTQDRRALESIVDLTLSVLD